MKTTLSLLLTLLLAPALAVICPEGQHYNTRMSGCVEDTALNATCDGGSYVNENECGLSAYCSENPYPQDDVCAEKEATGAACEYAVSFGGLDSYESNGLMCKSGYCFPTSDTTSTITGICSVRPIVGEVCKNTNWWDTGCDQTLYCSVASADDVDGLCAERIAPEGTCDMFLYDEIDSNQCASGEGEDVNDWMACIDSECADIAGAIGDAVGMAFGIIIVVVVIGVLCCCACIAGLLYFIKKA